MKRVLEVFGEPISRGGQESYVMSAIQHMDLSEINIDLFTPYYCDNQVYIHFIEEHNGSVVSGNQPFIVGGTRREIIPVFEEYLSNNKYDIVHIHSGSISVLAYYARIASLNHVKKVIVHSHSSGYRRTVKHSLVKIYAARLFTKYATDYCACSVEAARWKFPNTVLSKVKILNNGVDLDKFKYNEFIRKQIRNYWGIKDNEIVLGHVGRFTEEKNQAFLIELMREYLITNNNVRLILVGDGDKKNELQLKAKEYEIDRKIIFTGASDKVSDIFNCFDIFLFPSIYEGFGIVGIEAQANGLPVIASQGIPRSMQVSKNVVFLSLNEKKEWIKNIDLFSKMKRFDNYGEIVSRGFDIKDTSNELLNLYCN